MNQWRLWYTSLTRGVWQTYGQYWPEENEECECGPFVIEAVSVSRKMPEITARELKMSFNQSVSVVNTCQVIFYKDPSDEISSKSRRLSPQRRGWRVLYVCLPVKKLCIGWILWQWTNDWLLGVMQIMSVIANADFCLHHYYLFIYHRKIMHEVHNKI